MKEKRNQLMKKIVVSSLYNAEIAAYLMLMLLFFLNTNRPYLLLVPVAFKVSGYFVFTKYLHRYSEGNKAIPFMITFTLVLGFLIAVMVVGLIYLLR